MTTPLRSHIAASLLRSSRPRRNRRKATLRRFIFAVSFLVASALVAVGFLVASAL